VNPVTKKTAFYLAATGLAVLAALLILRDSEEDRIMQRLEALRVLTEVREPESAVRQAVVAREIGSYFSEKTRFDLSGLAYRVVEFPSRQELVRKALQGRAALTGLELGLEQPEIRIDGDRARVEVVGSALGSLRGEHRQFLDIHRVEITLQKLNGAWLVTGGRHIRDERADARGHQPPL
jgi:hypothetical protein